MLEVAEAVGNAWRHGAPPVTARIWAGSGRILVHVHDTGPGPDDPLAGVSGNRTRTVVSSTVPGVTEPAIGPHDTPPHAGQLVRRMLLRRNIVIDAETA